MLFYWSQGSSESAIQICQEWQRAVSEVFGSLRVTRQVKLMSTMVDKMSFNLKQVD
jgi:very-short-patch-repair endonuclease